MFNPKTLLVSFLMLSYFGHAQYYQRSQLDSLKTVLENQTGKQEIGTLLELAEAYRNFQLDTALLYTKTAKNLSQQTNYEWGYCKSLHCQAQIEKEFKKTEQPGIVLKNCAEWFTNNGFEKDGIISQIAFEQILFMNEGAEIAYEFGLKTHKRVKILNDPGLLGASWLQLQQYKPNLIEDKNTLGSYDSAAYYFKKTTDSVKIVTTDLYRKMRLNSPISNFEYLYEAKGKVQRWGNTKMLYATYWFLEIAYLTSFQTDSVLHYHDMSMELAKTFYSDSSRMGDPRILGHMYQYMDSLDLSLKYFNQALDRINRFGIDSDRSGLLRAMGNVKVQQGDYQGGVETLLQVIDLSKEKKNDVDTYSVKLELAKLHTLMNEFEKSQEISREVIYWADTALTGEPRERLLFSGYLELGKAYNQSGDYVRASENYNLSKEFEMEFPRFHYQTDICILDNYLDQQDLSNADQKYNEILEKYSSSLYIQNSPFHLQKGRLLLEKREYTKAIDALESYFLFRPGKGLDRDKSNAYYYLYQAYNEIDKKGLALKNYVQYATTRDSLKTGQTTADIQKIQSDHEISLKESEIEGLRQKQEISDLNLAQQKSQLSVRNLYIAVLIFAFLTLAMIGYLVLRRLKLKKEEEKKEMKQKLEIENFKTQQKVQLAEIKNNLYANISHEFKTPLTLIRVPLLEFSANASEKEKPILDSIVRNTDHLLGMLDELLDVSKMQSGAVKLHPSTFNLGHLLSQIRIAFAPLFSEKDIQFDWSTDLAEDHFFGDENKLNIVISNLLKNAFSNTAKNGWVNCKIALDQELKIVVTNKGEQISPTDLPHIFERFYRASNSTYEGNGIGLAWSKQIVELHHGTIQVDNSKNGQVSFIVHLPITGSLRKPVTNVENKSHSGPAETAVILNNLESSEHNQNLSHILVVEDNREMQELIAHLLQEDFHLDFAENGEIGEEMAIRLQPDLVLSDVMMPKKDGFELLKALKENFNSSHIPVVLLTAKGDSTSRIAGLNQDADDYINKPFDPVELKARINNLLRQRSRLHELFSENPFRYSKEIKFTEIDTEFLTKANNILENHFSDGDFSTDKFCSELASNRTSINHKLKALTNQTTAEFIKNFRIKKAEKMLLETERSVADICVACGFNSPQAFNKAFKKKLDLSPSKYRAEIRK